MKRKFLIWSALLTVVFGAALLQSCSADDDTFATEEYGYYTEEEIDAIKGLAKMYGITINIDESTYEVKKTLSEFEEEIMMHASLLGEYELVPAEGGEKGQFIARKKENCSMRTMTRAAESGSWNYSFTKGIYTFRIDISWSFPKKPMEPGTASGTITATSSSMNYYGSLHCGMGSQGTDTVTFSGYISLGYYTYYITQGSFSISTNAGSFMFENESYHKQGDK